MKKDILGTICLLFVHFCCYDLFYFWTMVATTVHCLVNTYRMTEEVCHVHFNAHNAKIFCRP